MGNPNHVRDAFPAGSKFGTIEVMMAQNDGQRMIKFQNGQELVVNLDRLYLIARQESSRIKDDPKLPLDLNQQAEMEKLLPSFGAKPIGEIPFLLRMGLPVTTETMTNLRRVLKYSGRTRSSTGAWVYPLNPQFSGTPKDAAKVPGGRGIVRGREKAAAAAPQPRRPKVFLVPSTTKEETAAPSPCVPAQGSLNYGAPSAAPAQTAPPSPAQTVTSAAPTTIESSIQSLLGSFTQDISDVEATYKRIVEIASDGLANHRREKMARVEALLAQKQPDPIVDRATALQALIVKLG